MKRSHPRSAECAVRAMVNVAKGPPPVPAHMPLRAEDRPFWDAVIRSRARDEWTANDLQVAVQLARTQADIETESALLQGEGSVVENARGTKVMNARVTVMEGLCRREMALMRSLRMGGKDGGDARDEVGRRKLERQAETLRGELEDDSVEELLAT